MGLFSKIGKAFKKVVKGVGKVIKKVAKPIGKVFKKVLKPFAKVFGKLGFVGSLALSMILPGLGGLMGTWFNRFGGAAANLFTPDSFMHKMVTGFVDKVNGFANWAGRRYNDVTSLIKDGVNAITKPFMADGKTFTGAFEDMVNDMSGRINKGEGWKAPWEKPTASDFADVDIPKGFETQDIYDMRGEGFTSKFDNVDIPKGFETQDIYDMRGEGFTETKKGVLDKIEDLGTRFKESKVGRAVGIYETGSGIYNKYLADAPEAPFFNANINQANDMLMNSIQGQMDNYVTFDNIAATRPVTSHNDLAAAFSSGFGSVTPESVSPMAWANAQQAYGYNLGAHAQKWLGYGNQPKSPFVANLVNDMWQGVK